MTGAPVIDLGQEKTGLLKCFVEVCAFKKTGIAVLKGKGAGRADFKKQYAFEKGEPVAVLSNRPQERLVYFLLQNGKISQEELATLKNDGVDLQNSTHLIKVLIQKALLSTQDLPRVLESFLEDRLFNLLDLQRGDLEFKEMSALPDQAKHVEVVRLSKPFSVLLLGAITKVFDEKFCASFFKTRTKGAFKISGDSKIPLSGSLLREWKQLQSTPLSISEARLIQKQLLVLAEAMDLLVFQGETSSGLEEKLQKTYETNRKATFFEVLGVSEDAPPHLLKKAYVQLVKQYHPDRLLKAEDQHLKELCESVLAQINEAFDVLFNDEKREEYIAERELEKQGGLEGIQKRLEAEGQFDAAHETLIQKNYQKALEMLKPLEVTLTEMKEFQADLLFAQAMVDHSAGKFSTSQFQKYVEILESIYQERPRLSYVLYYLGILHKILGDAASAAECFQGCLQEAPHFKEAELELRILQKQREKDKPKAKSWFSR